MSENLEKEIKQEKPYLGFCLAPLAQQQQAGPASRRPSPPPPLLSFSRCCRAELIAAVHRSHSHRLPLASPTRSPAPPRPPLPPRRATQDGAPRGAVAVAIFASGRRGSSPSIRELPGIPDLALALAGLAVSPRTEPPPPRCRFLPPTAGSVEPESSSPPATRSPRLEPPHVASEHPIVLPVPRGCH